MAYKNLTSQQEADILKEFERGGLGQLKTEIEENIFSELSNRIIDIYREVIEERTRAGASGGLKSSVVAMPQKDGFDIEADAHFKFVDEGVNAAPRKAGLTYVKGLVVGSPYSFKNYKVPSQMVRSIYESGAGSMSDAYGIAIGVKKYGIKAKNITNDVLTDELFEKISEDLSTMLGIAVEVAWNKSLNQ